MGLSDGLLLLFSLSRALSTRLPSNRFTRSCGATNVIWTGGDADDPTPVFIPCVTYNIAWPLLSLLLLVLVTLLPVERSSLFLQQPFETRIIRQPSKCWARRMSTPSAPIQPQTVTNLSFSFSSVTINGAECGAEAILLGATTSIGGFLFGYDTGQISGMLLFDDFINRFAQTNSAGEKEWVPIIQSLVVSLMSIGSLLGALSGA